MSETRGDICASCGADHFKALDYDRMERRNSSLTRDIERLRLTVELCNSMREHGPTLNLEAERQLREAIALAAASPPLQEETGTRELEHWMCPNCGEVDGPRAGRQCHGPDVTAACTLTRAQVIGISAGAARRLTAASLPSGDGERATVEFTSLELQAIGAAVYERTSTERDSVLAKLSQLVPGHAAAAAAPPSGGGKPERTFKCAAFSGPHPSLTVDCPTCGSPAGHYCNDGDSNPSDRPHETRKALALATVSSSGETGEDWRSDPEAISGLVAHSLDVNHGCSSFAIAQAVVDDLTQHGVLSPTACTKCGSRDAAPCVDTACPRYFLTPPEGESADGRELREWTLAGPANTISAAVNPGNRFRGPLLEIGEVVRVREIPSEEENA